MHNFYIDGLMTELGTPYLVSMEETYDNIVVILYAIKYKQFHRQICGDLKGQPVLRWVHKILLCIMFIE